MITSINTREINKLFGAYDRAEVALVTKRNELFPEGTKVRSRINPHLIATIKSGSWYPHCVNTDSGHMSWRYLEKLDD